MGIGVALASGFLKGMVEGKKAKAEAEKLEQEKSLARFEKEQDRIFELVKSGIDLDPRVLSAYGLDYLVGVSNSINKAENTTLLGASTSLPFQLKISNAGETLETIEDLDAAFAGNGYDMFIQQLEIDPQAKEQAKSRFNTVFNAHNTYYHKANSFNNDGKFMENKYFDYTVGAPNFKRVLDYLEITGRSQFEQPPTVISASDDDSTRELKPGEFVVRTSEGTHTTPQLFSSHAQSMGVTEEQLKAGAETMAQVHGMNGGAQQVYYNANLLSYGSQTPQFDVKNANRGALLANIGAQNLENISADENPNLMTEVVAATNRFGGGTAENKFADENVFEVKQSIFAVTRIEPEYESAPPSVLTGISGSDYAREKKIDLDQFRNQFAANDETLEMLKQLKALYNIQDETGLYLAVKRLGIGLVVQAKQFSDMFSNSDNTLLNSNLGENTNAGSLEKILKNLNYDIRNLSTIDALKISLAAKMARAIDPSGRLSNQDFEVQLRRLGDTGFFDLGKTGRDANLDLLISEFTVRYKDMKDTNDIINKREITAEDRRWLAASASYRKIARYRRGMFAAQQAQTGDTSTGDEEAASAPLNRDDFTLNQRTSDRFGLTIYKGKADGQWAYDDPNTGQLVLIPDIYNFNPKKITRDN